MVQSVQTLQREFSLAHYTWGPRIGTGGQGSVYEYSFNGNVYAAKVLYYTNEEETSNEDPSADVKRFREFCVMPRLSHAHVIRAYELFNYPKEGFVIIMPYFRRGNLKKLNLDLPQLKEATRQILEGLRHLHEQSLIHRDIKPENVLVRSMPNEPLDLVVADFGLVSMDNAISVCGTNRYMAPEIVDKGKVMRYQATPYDNSVDIYALGMLMLWGLGISILSISILNRRSFEKHIQLPIAEALDGCDEDDVERREALLTAERMLQYDAKLRPSADKCLRLKWLAQPAVVPPTLQVSRKPTNRPTADTSAGNLTCESKKRERSPTPKSFTSYDPGYDNEQDKERECCHENEKIGGRYERRKRFRTQRYSPVDTLESKIIQRSQTSSLLTPDPTPKRGLKASSNLGKSQSPDVFGQNPLSKSWDKIDISD